MDIEASDRRRAFARPLLLAKYCTGLVEHLRRWEAQETGSDSRKLIFAPSDNSSVHPHSISTSKAIRQSVHSALLQEFQDAQQSRQQSRYDTAKLKVPNRRLSTLPSKTSDNQDRKLQGKTTVDAARFLGELFREHTFVDQSIVVSWLKSLLLEPRSWVDVPFYDLEAACALLLLIGPHWDAGTAQHGTVKEHSAMNITDYDQDRSQKEHDIIQLSLKKLQEMVESHILPDMTKNWVTDVIHAGRNHWR
ncbi:hypothetical protein MPSI1_000276 [Malassezia psittaci]|uniref:Uncharacterized protein n=1 Tax=Malassezia psittaci TaxID=1821823 RepID=A0AAF0F7U8_9BASI|nr:hypothetical protein MPSI1_000276 [Malassezia psittaci]